MLKSNLTPTNSNRRPAIPIKAQRAHGPRNGAPQRTQATDLKGSIFLTSPAPDAQIECQYAIYTSRWCVRNYVRIVCQGVDHSREVI